jgi:diguanylate cyclase (GGDEF)-like protein
MEMGERENARAKRFHRNLSALMIDIDSFKEINDTHGHAAGDIVLKVIADRILGSIREIDILGRYGGDEFAILLPESEWEKIPEIASRILRSMVNEPIDNGGTYVRLTASLGAARMKGQSSSLESLLSEADEALYRVKQTGKNHFEISP